MVAGNGNGKAPFIRLHQVTKTFKVASEEVTVLRGIDADFYEGEFVGVIGKSGSGKSTLVNMITGIDRPTSGEVCIGETEVHRLSENQLAIWRGRNVGIVFQFFQLLPMLSLVENIMLPMDFCHMYTPRLRKERAMHLLKLVEMQEHAHKLPSAISGGQQQRVAIARSLANDPPILVADEPTGNLDSKTAESIFSMFDALVKEGKTILMVTHDSAQAKRVNRTLLIADGEIVNQWVARALPSLTHQQMLKATHELKPLHFAPGETIIQQDVPGNHFYIITNGQAEVALKRPGGADVVVKRLSEGQYFGEVALYRGGNTTANVRAAPEMPVEVIALDREAFTSLLDESEETRKVIGQIVTSRVTETKGIQEVG